MVPIFQTWDKLFCPESAECTIESAVYNTIYSAYDLRELENNIDIYMMQLQAVWIRPNLVEIDGKQKNMQAFLEKKARTDDMAKIMAKNYQTYANHTQQGKALYESILSRYNQGLSNRQKAEADDELPTFPEMLGTFEIDFSFKVGKELYVVITDDPPEIMFKSQGRPWEGGSCERFTGPYSSGFVTDIEVGNLIAYIIDKHGMPVARKMIRWGDGHVEEKHVIALNLEPVWYYDDLPIHPQERDEFLQIVDEQLWAMIREHRYYADYVKTPYLYEGFSDAMGRRGYIEYQNADFEEPEAPYLIFQSDIGEHRIIYANTLSRLERQDYLNNDFEYADEDEALMLYLMNIDDNTAWISNWDDFINYLILILEPAKIDDFDQAVEWDEAAQEWIIDTNNKWFDIHMEEENNTDIILTQTNNIYYYFWRRGILTDEDLYVKEWLKALFHQYGRIISQLNFSAGLFCDTIGRNKSFVGTLRGDRLFYFKDVKTLFTEKDQNIRSTILTQLEAGEIGNS